MEKLTNIIEAILFVSGDAVSVTDIAEKLLVSKKEVNAAAAELELKYGESSGVRLLVFNGKLQFGSNKDYAEQVASVLNPIKERELSRSMLETAAIIAYKQPVTRMDLEEIRGNSEYAVQCLLKLGVIEVVGRKDAIGRPSLFGTTDKFLKRFQISSLDELPDYETLITQIKQLRGAADEKYLFSKDVYSEENDPELRGETIDVSEQLNSAKKRDSRAKDKASAEKIAATSATAQPAEQASEAKDEQAVSAEQDDDDFVIKSGVSHSDADDDYEDEDDNIDDADSSDDDDIYSDADEEKDDSDYSDDDEDDDDDTSGDDDDDFNLKDVSDEDVPDFLKNEKINIVKG